MNVVEHQDEDSDDEQELTDAAQSLNVDSAEAHKNITDIRRARQRIHKKAMQLQNHFKLQAKLREDHISSSPDDAVGRGGHSRGNSSEMSSP